MLIFFAACGGVRTSDSGVITSPNFPDGYSASSSCAWKIVAPPGQQIEVHTR